MSTTTSKQTQSKYVILQETSEEEFESWMYFIKLEGNENNLSYLKHQLDQVDWKIYEGFSTFDLDMDHLVSEQTAKEMTKVELNVYFHRKFDGELKRIDFGIKPKDNNKKRIKRVFYKLGHGMIDKYIDQEDVSDVEDDEDDEGDHELSDADTVSSTEESEDEDEDEDEEDEDEDEEDVEDVDVEEEEDVSRSSATKRGQSPPKDVSLPKMFQNLGVNESSKPSSSKKGQQQKKK